MEEEVIPETCCCGCCTVEIGTIYIAVLGIIGSLLGAFVSSVRLLGLLYGGPGPNLPSEPYLITQLISFLLYIFLSCILIVGAVQRKYRKCLPWLYWNYVAILVPIVMGFVQLHRFAKNRLFLEAIVFGVGYGIVLAIAIYFVNVVRRFVTELKSD